MIIEQMRTRIKIAMREQDVVTRDILRTCLSEASKSGEPTDELVIKACKKIIEANKETLKLGGENEKLSRENQVLAEYLPQEVVATRDDVDRVTSEYINLIKESKNEKQITGLVIKELKLRGFTSFNINDVNDSIQVIRTMA